MTVKITCWTMFDISPTGLRGNYVRNRVPFVDNVGNQITDEATWHRSRNQQRNWETMNQLISLRALPVNITNPRVDRQGAHNIWRFDFEIENISMLSNDSDPLGSLKSDCQGVPMIQRLGETQDLLQPTIDIGANTDFVLVDK